jgi:hypothetical protein
MAKICGFFGGLLVFFGAACVVTEVLRFTVGEAQSLFSLEALWVGLDGPNPRALLAQEGLLVFVTSPLRWFLALPSWLVFLALGGVLMLTGGRGRERTFG